MSKGFCVNKTTLLIVSLIICIGAFIVPDSAFAQAATLPLPKTWVANGPVWAMKHDFDIHATLGTDLHTMYIGGNFTYVGPETGNMVRISAAGAWESGFFPNVLGTVYACIPDGLDGWFIGGDFQWVDGTRRNRIAHILSTGRLDRNFDADPDINDTVYALALARDGQTLFAGGKFTKIGEQECDYLCALDARPTSSDFGMATDWNPEADGVVDRKSVV